MKSIPLLPESIRAIAISLRGHGDSDRPEVGYTPDDFAADVAAFMDRKGIERAIIAGHSMGSIVAQRLTLSYPTRTQGLILIGSFTESKTNANLIEFWESTVSKLEDPIDPEIARSFQLSTVANPLPETFLDLVIRESLKVPARVWKDAFRGLMSTDLSRELHTIRIPVTLLWGDRDTFVTRSDQDRLLAAIPTSVLSVYKGVGHAPHWESPARCAHEIASFVSHTAV